MNESVIFAGTANPELAQAIAGCLNMPLGASEVERFPDGEVSIRINESIRRKDVFIIQPTSPPVNDHLVELLTFADACRRSSAASITAIVPYFGYARADKRGSGRREPITASLVAALMQTAGIDHLLTLDLHTPQLEGFFHIPVDSLTAEQPLSQAIAAEIPGDVVVVSPDAGRVPLATRYAHHLGTSVVVLHKQRKSGSETKVTHIVGDVRARTCLIIDDMISTGGTIAESVEALISAGARAEVYVAATHGLFTGNAAEKLRNVHRLFVTNTVAVCCDGLPQVRVVSIAPLLATAINRIMYDGSLNQLC